MEPPTTPPRPSGDAPAPTPTRRIRSRAAHPYRHPACDEAESDDLQGEWVEEGER